MNQPREDAGNEWDTTAYDEDHSIVFEYGEGVVDLLEPETGERILDLGCGTGHLTDQIADSGADAVGLDASEEMIREARKIHPECEFLHADARNVSFSEPFDAVFSNAALHWISEQDLSSTGSRTRSGLEVDSSPNSAGRGTLPPSSARCKPRPLSGATRSVVLPERRRVHHETRRTRLRGALRVPLRPSDRARRRYRRSLVVARDVRRQPPVRGSRRGTAGHDLNCRGRNVDGGLPAAPRRCCSVD